MFAQCISPPLLFISRVSHVFFSMGKNVLIRRKAFWLDFDLERKNKSPHQQTIYHTPKVYHYQKVHFVRFDSIIQLKPIYSRLKHKGKLLFFSLEKTKSHR